MKATKKKASQAPPVIDLITKYQANKAEFTAKIQDAWNYHAVHPTYKVGDVIEFWGGHGNDIRYRSEIIGFTPTNEIFVLWDCFWFPIRDEASRNIVKF